MKAAVQFDVPGKLHVVDVEIDRPRGREILIRTEASGLCHSDLHFMEGKYQPDLPVVLGHEAAGVVEAVGDGVTGVEPGDHVVTCLSTFCGMCAMCLRGRPVLCTRQGLERSPSDRPRLSLDGRRVHAFNRLGAFAERMLIHENSAVVIRKDMPLDRAALIGCGVVTGVGAVVNTARVEPGNSVAVIGCGGIGLNAIQGAALAGANRIVAIDRLAWKLEIARDFGATDIVDASEEDPVSAVLDLVPGGVDHAIEAIGLKSTAEQAFAMLARGGTATIVGMIPEGEKIEIPGDVLMGDEKRVQGSNMGSNRFRIDIPRYVDLYMTGRLELDSLLSARISLNEVNEGYDALLRGEVARSVIVFPDPPENAKFP
jgi:S-(hydroxymethyl)glutathione dehydrogenase / alcohol dehydrogenase